MIKGKVLLVFLFFLFSLLAVKAQTKSTFDLRGKNFEESFTLEGSWDFYWEQLLDSTKQLGPSRIQVQLPHDWTSETINGELLPAAGYATYAVQLLVDKERDQIGMYIPHAFSSYRLIVNDSIIWNSGEVADNVNDYRAYREPKVVSLREFKTDTLNILIQVANYDHYNAGLYFPLEVSLYESLIRHVRTNQGISLFLAGGFFITGIVLLAFSTVYRHLSLPIPFYAFFSLSMMYRLVGTDYYPLHAMFNDFNFHLAICLEYLSAYSSALFGGLFVFFMYPKQTPNWTKWSFVIITVSCMIVTIITESMFFTSILRYYLIVLIAYLVFFLFIIFKAKSQKEPTSDYLVTTVLIVFVFTVAQTLSFLGITGPIYELRVVLMSAMIIFCNLALFRTFVMRINLVKHAEAEIEYQKSRQTMLSLISHEIKMPVASLQMNMEMIKMSSDRPEKFDKVKDKVVDLSLNAVETIKRMLHDFIYFMSLEEVTKEKLSFDDLKSFVADNWELPIVVEPNSVVDSTKYLTDKMSLKYILSTVIGNAEKFTRPFEPSAEIHFTRNNEGITLEVRDFGVGISHGKIEELGKGGAKIDENQEISGMGFYLAKDLAQRLGHKLWIISRGTEGTSVFVSIKAP